MKNTLKKVIGAVMVVALLLGVLAMPSQDVQAAVLGKKGKTIYYGSVWTKGKDEFGRGAIYKITFKGNKMIVKGSLIEATSKKKLYKNKGSYLKKATRTFKLDKKFNFYGTGGDMGTVRYTLKEGKRLCKYAEGLGLEFKVKNKKLVSLTFCS